MARTRTLVAGLGLLSAVSLTGDALSPTLIASQPLLLVGLAPRAPYLLAASHGAPLLAVLAVAVPRLLVADPVHFLLGRRHGARLLRGLPAGVDRVGLPVIVASPTGKFLVAAGAGGLRASHVGAADLAGTVLRVAGLWLAANSLPGAAALVDRPLVAGLLAAAAAIVIAIRPISRLRSREAPGNMGPRLGGRVEAARGGEEQGPMSVEEAASLDAVVARLHSEFSAVDTQLVLRVVTESFDAVARDATVRSFIPVLAQRQARTKLAALVAS